MHEAGHATIQMLQNGSPHIDEVWIFREGESDLGRVVTNAAWQPANVDLLKYAGGEALEIATRGLRRAAAIDVIQYLAGPIAELRWRGSSRPAIQLLSGDLMRVCLGEPAPPDGSDLGRVRRRLNWSHAEDPACAFTQAWMEAEEAVAANWPRIVRLGRALAHAGTLNYAEIRDCLG
jgi:hypothetical protein